MNIKKHVTPEQYKDGITMSLFKRLSAVPGSVRGLLADSLTDWLEAAKAAQEEDVLDERIAEINRAYAVPGANLSITTKGLVENLEDETRIYRKNVAAESDENFSRRERERRESKIHEQIDRDQKRQGERYRDIMTHRVGRTGRTQPRVFKKI